MCIASTETQQDNTYHSYLKRGNTLQMMQVNTSQFPWAEMFQRESIVLPLSWLLMKITSLWKAMLSFLMMGI